MRTDILKRKDDILKWIEENQPKAYICRQLECKPETLEKYLGIMGIEYSGNFNRKGFSRMDSTYKPAAEYIKGNTVSSSILRKKLILEGIKENKCERCGLTLWLGEPISLELHHKDGNHYNNDFENLEILCPNCHSLTQNYRHRGDIKISETPQKPKAEKDSLKREAEKTNKCIDCGKPISKKATRCDECNKKHLRKVERPSRENLKEEIRSIPFQQLGQKYGVSGKSISKWCIYYNLPYKKSDIKTYNDEEWSKI